MKAAIVGGIFAIVAALIPVLIALHSTASSQSNTSSNSPQISSTSAPVQSNSSTTFPPVSTQPAQSTYPDVRGTYSITLQSILTGLSVSWTLTITQQNQGNFQGSISNNGGSNPITGTVDRNGNIQFTGYGTDSSGNQETLTFTGTVQSGGGWRGTYSANFGDEGTWYTTP